MQRLVELGTTEVQRLLQVIRRLGGLLAEVEVSERGRENRELGEGSSRRIRIASRLVDGGTRSVSLGPQLLRHSLPKLIDVR